jgi:hypothetical protein
MTVGTAPSNYREPWRTCVVDAVRDDRQFVLALAPRDVG